MVRDILSHLARVPSSELRISIGDQGRPEIETPPDARRLRFSLSHTRGLIVCLTAWDRQVGVDAERLRYGDSLLDVADRHFDLTEAAAVRTLSGAERHVRFFELWTLKEAYAKALGTGLVFPLSRVAFDLERVSSTGIRARFASEVKDEASRWQFGLHRITGEHVVATALERSEGASVKVKVNAIG
jgi:4'-phosphopantetheinyl transferase